MVALEAVARLRAGGADARLDVCGSVFPGYEWFEAEGNDRAETFPYLPQRGVARLPKQHDRQEYFQNHI